MYHQHEFDLGNDIEQGSYPDRQESHGLVMVSLKLSKTPWQLESVIGEVSSDKEVKVSYRHNLH